MIPKVVYYTHENIEKVKKFENELKYSKSKNKNYKFIFYDDNAIIKFIKENFPEFYEFYKRINKGYGAAKADIFRVLILHKYGGIYIDCKTQIENMDELFVKYPNKNLYTCSFKKDDTFQYIGCKMMNMVYQNFFIATEKEGQVISAIKDEMFYRLNSFGKNVTYTNMFTRLIRGKESSGEMAVWTHTGPCLFTQVIKKNAFSDSVFDVALADKQYVIYDSHKSYAYINLYNRFNRDRFLNSYHHNKRPFFKDV
jgi:mannosyltransferase OCH1-like enzyme